MKLIGRHLVEGTEPRIHIGHRVRRDRKTGEERACRPWYVEYSSHGVKHYEKLVEIIDGLFDFTDANIEAALRAYGEENELKPKNLFMPIRFMVTGKKATPPLFETMAVLGRERCRYRMRQAIAAFKAWTPPKK